MLYYSIEGAPMYYSISEKNTLSSPPTKGEAFLAYLSLDQLIKDRSELGVSREVLEISREENPHNILLAQEDYYYIILLLPNLKESNLSGHPLGIFLDKTKLLLINLEEEELSKEFFQGALSKQAKLSSPSHFLFSFLREILHSHYEKYLAYQAIIQNFEEKIWITESKNKKLEHDLSSLSIKLLVLQNFYDQLSELLDQLEEYESDILPEKELPLLLSLHSRVDHYANNIHFLKDYLVSLRSTYQAQLTLSMNAVMKIFTVISAVFLPLTLFVGWYGMNFKYMPELGWRYGYLGFGAFILLTSGLILLYLRKRKLL